MKNEKFKIVPTVYLVLITNSEILLARRFNTCFHDGDYSFPAGHLDGNETLTHAMVREAKEETGIDLKEKNLKLVHIIHRKETVEERINFFLGNGVGRQVSNHGAK